MNRDIKRIESAILGGTNVPEALEALKRIEARLPTPTVQEQFDQFPVGTVFQTDPSSDVTFVKTGVSSLVRVDHGFSSGVLIEYHNGVKTALPHWSTLTDELTEVL